MLLAPAQEPSCFFRTDWCVWGCINYSCRHLTLLFTFPKEMMSYPDAPIDSKPTLSSLYIIKSHIYLNKRYIWVSAVPFSVHSLVLGHNLKSCPLISCISSFFLQIANRNTALSPFGRCYWKKLQLIFPTSKAQLSLALKIVMNLYIGWLMFVFLSLEKFCSSKPWFSLLRFTPVAFPWSLSTLAIICSPV